MNAYAVIIVIGYLIGSIPSGLLIGKGIYNIDLRQFGSKNIGATNTFRVLGLRPALAVFAGDALKGIGGVMLGQYLIGTPTGQLIGGIAAMLGHNWSVFLKFQGGRGVATGLGIIAILVPNITVIIIAVWALIVYFTRYVSLASIVSAILLPLLTWLTGAQIEYLYFGLLGGLFVIVRHYANIRRLLNGTELKIKAGSANSDSLDDKERE